jgi:hypothetical protein
MKFGIYGAAGETTCASRVGSLYHERVDAQSYADWGADYLKVGPHFVPMGGIATTSTTVVVCIYKVLEYIKSYVYTCIANCALCSSLCLRMQGK